MRELINLISENQQTTPDAKASKADLQQLEQIVAEHPEVEGVVNKHLQSLLTYTQKVLAKLNLQTPAMEAVESTEDLIAQLSAGIDIIQDNIIQRTLREQLDKLTQAIVQRVTQEREAGKQEKEQQLSQARTEKLQLAQTIATRLKKSKSWAQNLLSAAERFGEQLSLDFLTVCAQGQGLTVDLAKTQGVSKIRLPNITNSKIQGIFAPEHREAFRLMLLLPFTESPGMGGGIGPGESLLGCLVGNSTSATPGDLSIDGETWELKAGSYRLSNTGGIGQSTAWIDSSKVKGPALRAVFDKLISDILKTKLRSNVTVRVKNEDRVVKAHEAIALADFRSTGLPYLKGVFSLLSPQQQYSLLEAMYNVLFSAVNQYDANVFSQSVKQSIEAINSLDIKTLGQIQVKLAFIDYGVGHYKSPNFLIYNTTTQDVLVIRGIDALDQVFNQESNISTMPATMGKGDKASPGVFVNANDPDEVDSILGRVRKRPRKTVAESLTIHPLRQKR